MNTKNSKLIFKKDLKEDALSGVLKLEGEFFIFKSTKL